MNLDSVDLDIAKEILDFLQNYNLFGELLVLLREESGINAAQLAKKLDVTSAAMTQWSKGKRLPDSGMVYRIEKALDLSSGDETGLKTAWDSTRFFRGYIDYLEEAIAAKDLKTVHAILESTGKDWAEGLWGDK